VETDVTTRPDFFDRFLRALKALTPFITAITGAAMTGHSIGWW
jgi:hypothetical protein